MFVQTTEGAEKDIDKFPRDKEPGFVPPLVVGEGQETFIVAGRSEEVVAVYVDGQTGKVEVDKKDVIVIPGRPYISKRIEIHAADN